LLWIVEVEVSKLKAESNQTTICHHRLGNARANTPLTAIGYLKSIECDISHF
jgi:hypothetical protein